MDRSYTIGEVCDVLKCEQHTLRYIEKTLDMKIERDEFMNRLYSQENLDTLRMVFDLKDQGLNYGAIKKVLEQQSEIVQDKVDETRKDVVIQNQNLEQLIKVLTKEISESVAATVESRFEGLTRDIENLKLQNEELQRQIQKSQEQHFSELDNKLSRLREEMKENQTKSWLSKLFGK
jgi:DNA-binding transcriptional MerR regulator